MGIGRLRRGRAMTGVRIGRRSLGGLGCRRRVLGMILREGGNGCGREQDRRGGGKQN